MSVPADIADRDVKRIAVVHSEFSGRIVVLRPAAPHCIGVALFSESDRKDRFDEDLARLVEITGYPVVEEHMTAELTAEQPGPQPAPPAEEKVTDLMQALFDSVEEAKAARDRHVAHRRLETTTTTEEEQ